MYFSWVVRQGSKLATEFDSPSRTKIQAAFSHPLPVQPEIPDLAIPRLPYVSLPVFCSFLKDSEKTEGGTKQATCVVISISSPLSYTQKATVTVLAYFSSSARGRDDKHPGRCLIAPSVCSVVCTRLDGQLRLTSVVAAA